MPKTTSLDIVATAETEAPVGPLLPLNPTFAGHQTFPVRGGWLKKGLDAVRDDPEIFSRPNALAVLGVGKNMVVAIRHWLLATRLAKVQPRGMAATDLGTRLFGPTGNGWDPYLEDPATLWLLHWNLCGPGGQSFTSAWTFNHWHEWEWSRDTLRDAVHRAAETRAPKAPSLETVGRDVGVLIQTYASSEDRGQNSEDGLDCPLRDLGLIRTGTEQRYRFAVGPKTTLPASVFAWALLQFWGWKHSGSHTLSASEISHTEGSPGVVFKLDDETVLEYLDGLDQTTSGVLSFEDSPLVRQVLRHREVPASTLLDGHYAQQSS